MKNAKKQMMYAAIGLFLMTIVDLIIFLLPVEVSQNLVVNTATVLMFIALETWAFVSVFRTSSKGTMLRSGSIVGLVCCAVALLNWVWVLVDPMDSLRFYIAYIPLNILMILAMTTMLLDCKKDVLVSVVGWVYVGLKLLSTSLFLFRVEWYFGWPAFTIVFIGDLLFAAFLFFLSKSVAVETATREQNGNAAVDGVLQFNAKLSNGLTLFDVGTFVMLVLAVAGLTKVEDINDSIFYYSDAVLNPLIYSVFTFLSLAGVFFALSRIYLLNRYTQSASEFLRTRYGREVSGQNNIGLMMLGGLVVFVGIIALFVGEDVAKEFENYGALDAIINPLMYDTKLAFCIIGFGGVLMAFAWALKVNGWKKALKTLTPSKVNSAGPTFSAVILLALAAAAGCLALYFLIMIISGEMDGGGVFDSYYAYMILSAVLFAATCMLLYFISNSKRWILELMKVQDQPVKKEEKKEATEEQPAMVSKTDA